MEAFLGGVIAMGKDVIGEEHARKYLPFIATIGLFVLVNNLIGIITGFESPTSNINVTLTLALLVFIYYKYEGVSPPGSHKPNTAIAQAYYNKEAGIKRLTTETGAGQWGSALAFSCLHFGLECQVFMVRVSFEQKPYPTTGLPSRMTSVSTATTEIVMRSNEITALRIGDGIGATASANTPGRLQSPAVVAALKVRERP